MSDKNCYLMSDWNASSKDGMVLDVVDEETGIVKHLVSVLKHFFRCYDNWA